MCYEDNYSIIFFFQLFFFLVCFTQCTLFSVGSIEGASRGQLAVHVSEIVCPEPNISLYCCLLDNNTKRCWAQDVLLGLHEQPTALNISCIVVFWTQYLSLLEVDVIINFHCICFLCINFLLWCMFFLQTSGVCVNFFEGKVVNVGFWEVFNGESASGFSR